MFIKIYRLERVESVQRPDCDCKPWNTRNSPKSDHGDWKVGLWAAFWRALLAQAQRVPGSTTVAKQPTTQRWDD